MWHGVPAFVGAPLPRPPSVLLLALAGCAPDLAPVEEALAGSVPVGWAGAQAIAWAREAPGACVRDVTPCVGTPCSGAFAVEVGGDCPALPLAPEVVGEVGVTVVGQESTLLVTADFSGVEDASGARLRVDGFEGAIVSLDDDGGLVSVAGVDIAMRGGSVLEQAAWAIAVDGAGTPEPGDDTLVVGGAGQIAAAVTSTTAAQQVVLQDVTVAPTCALNPVAGTAFVQSVDAGRGLPVDYVVVQFEERCDGRAPVYNSSGGAAGDPLVIDLTAG